MGLRGWLAGTLTAALLVAGCSGAPAGSPTSAPASSEPASQSVVVWAEPWQVPALQALADSYGPANSVVVEVQPVAAEEMLARVQQAAPQGAGPDLFAGSNAWLGGLVSAGIVAPVDLADVRVGFSRQSLQAFDLDGLDYAVPYAAENLALLRNTALAKRAPESIEAMAEKGLVLKDRGRVDVAIALPIGSTGAGYHWYPFYSAADGYVFGQDIDGSYNPDNLGVGLPGSVQAGRELAALAEQGAIDPTLDAAAAARSFTAGRAAYLIGGPSEAEAARAGGIDLVVEPVPGFKGLPGSASQAMVSYGGFLMSAWATDRGASAKLLTTGLATTPFMDALFAARPREPAWLLSATKVRDDPRVAGFAEYAAASQPMPSLSVMPLAWEQLGQAQVEILSGTSSKAAMGRARAAIEAALATG